MRRIITWLLSTIAVVVLLFGYKTSTGSGVTSTASPTVVAAPSAGTPTASGQTFTGAVAQTRWGAVQVQITVANGKITTVTVPQYPDGNGHDQEINSYALPVLTKDTIANQNTTIDMISGATVTSNGYVESLQSALDQAGLA